MAMASDPAPIISRHGTIRSLLPYAIFLEQRGQKAMFNGMMKAIRTSEFSHFLSPIQLYITTLFYREPTPSLNWIIMLVSPHVNWYGLEHREKAVFLWARAALANPDTEEVDPWAMVETLFQIESVRHLRQVIPIEVWAKLKARRSLPPVCLGRRCGTTLGVVCQVQWLEDFEITK